MIVAGWADGYRNNSFRTVAALGRARRPAPAAGRAVGARRPGARRCPGPRIDLDAEMAAWFDRWLRGDGRRTRTGCDVFVRTSTRPELDLDLHEGRWVHAAVGAAGHRGDARPRPRRSRSPSSPDVGTAAWIDCAGHLPWGLSGDQRLDDARSLTWESSRRRRRSSATRCSGPGSGRPSRRRRCRSSSATSSPTAPRPWSPAAPSTSPTATASTASPSPLVPGREYDVEVVLDACAYQWTPGHTLRVSRRRRRLAEHGRAPGAGDAHAADGVADAAAAGRRLPRRRSFGPGAEHSSESTDGVGWAIHHDVLHRTTTATTRVRLALRHAVRRHRARALPRRGLRRHPHVRPAAQRQHRLRPDLARHRGHGPLDDDASTSRPTAYDVSIWTQAVLDSEEISHRTWQESIPR